MFLDYKNKKSLEEIDKIIEFKKLELKSFILIVN